MKIDFLQEDNDILIRGGDFVVDDAVRNHAETIIMASKGDLRNNPLLGANLNRFVGSSISELVLVNTIKNELIKEGITLLDIKLNRTSENIDIKINVIDTNDL